LLNIIAILVIVILPHYWPFSFFSYAPVCLLFLLWVLRRQKETLAGIGFRFNGFSWKAFRVGVLWAIAWALVYHYAIQRFVTGIFGLQGADLSDFNFLKHNTIAYILILLAGWLIGGWYEEIIFRGFIHHKTAAFFRGNKYSFLIASVFTSIVFGLYHIQQGPSGVIHAGLFAIIPSYFLYRYKGNLWYGMLFHAFYDTIGLTLIYIDYH